MNDLLLCELHAHTTWSDGHLTLSELIDLYGANRFDVLCVTDHCVRLDDPMPTAVDPAVPMPPAVARWTGPAYAAAIRAETVRARDEYDLVLVPGLELTDNCDDPELSTHALALGLDEHVAVDGGIVEALEAANDL